MDLIQETRNSNRFNWVVTIVCITIAMCLIVYVAFLTVEVRDLKSELKQSTAGQSNIVINNDVNSKSSSDKIATSNTSNSTKNNVKNDNKEIVNNNNKELKINLGF